jgi:hypothetical protein
MKIGLSETPIKTIIPATLKNNTVVASRPKAVRDLDQPFSVRLAATASMNDKNKNAAMNDRQQPATSVNVTQNQDSNNYTDDGIMVQHILDDLRKNVLSTGTEYDSAALESIIRARYPNVTPAIIQSVLSSIFSDVENMKARIAGSNYREMRILISTKNPNQLMQQ